jgi:hypothetical protein
MFDFENVPDIETVSIVSDFLTGALNIWENDRALVYCICRKVVVS